ncbi:MAG: hypothetical protein KAR00_02615 [Candidatus Pacebacteria bacterium]|nr:hypothetical protein [Candidatus Paceibacterota bacterium]
MKEESDDLLKLMDVALKDMPKSEKYRDRSGKKRIFKVEHISCRVRPDQED